VQNQLSIDPDNKPVAPERCQVSGSSKQTHFRLWVVGGDNHWSLAIVLVTCGVPVQAWHLDSLSLPQRLDKVTKELQALHPGVSGLLSVTAVPVPQQDNGYDCGWFTIARIMDVVLDPCLLLKLAKESKLDPDLLEHLSDIGDGEGPCEWPTTPEQAKQTMRGFYWKEVGALHVQRGLTECDQLLCGAQYTHLGHAGHA
jgi:hypothetical protein